MSLKQYIIDVSRELDIDIIGFTEKTDFTELKSVLDERQCMGYETEFEEKDIEKRLDSRLLLDSVESIIVVAMSTRKIGTEGEDSQCKTVGKLSILARIRDYHIVLEEKMSQLIKEIEKRVDFRYKMGVDTTPLIDRALAEAAGVGWYGKNSMIINDEFGSFISLGYILTDLKLTGDKAVKERCGSCDKCIRSCPVGAIKGGYKLNARRCISYLTQTKEDIPYDLRIKMRDNIYGCDICQMVCPKNKQVREVRKDSVNFSKDSFSITSIDTKEIFSMSNREFKKKYSETAFAWRGKNVIKRNCIIALANTGDKAHIEILKKCLLDESVMIRKYSAWAILELDSRLGIEILDNHLEKETEDEVIEEISRLREYFIG